MRFHLKKDQYGWGTHPILDIADGIDSRIALGICMTISYIMNFEEGEGSTTHL